MIHTSVVFQKLYLFFKCTRKLLDIMGILHTEFALQLLYLSLPKGLLYGRRRYIPKSTSQSLTKSVASQNQVQ